MKFFTSDWHIRHRKMFGAGSYGWVRSVYSSVEDMEKALLDSINATVGRDDELYFLGDAAMGGREGLEILRTFLRSLDCRNVVFLRGNHDSRGTVESLREWGYVVADEIDLQTSVGDTRLFHYPRPCEGKVVLCGHIHNNVPAYPNVVNLGVDSLVLYCGEEGYRGQREEDFRDHIGMSEGWIFGKPVSEEELPKVMGWQNRWIREGWPFQEEYRGEILRRR